jgi:uncharacterized membrane protein YhaH (DUF805 family)
MNWSLTVVTDNYTNFSGRARRSEYWSFVLVNFLIIFAIFHVSYFIHSEILPVIYIIAVLVPTLAVSVRRVHDLGRSGWYYIFVLLPILGWLGLIILLFTEGNSGSNKYGPDPKLRYEDINEIGKTED